MLVNYATILYTTEDVNSYMQFRNFDPDSIDSQWIKQYLKGSSFYQLPVVLSISESGYPDHQGITTECPTTEYIYNRYFSEFTLIPLEALLQPANYPEYYI